MADNLRLGGADPNAVPAITEQRRPPELHIHLHQLRRVVRRALEELPEEHHVPRGQRGGVFVSAKQTQRSARRLQGTQKIYRDLSYVAQNTHAARSEITQPKTVNSVDLSRPKPKFCCRWRRPTQKQFSNSERRGSPNCRSWTFCPRTTGCRIRPSDLKLGRSASTRVKVFLDYNHVSIPNSFYVFASH